VCARGALQAKIAPRFEGPKARALIAALIYLGPLLRGIERLKWRLKAMPQLLPEAGPAVEQRARLAWRAHGYVLSYWNDAGSEKEAMLAALMRDLAAENYPVAMGDGWSPWDLDVAGGPAGAARLTLADENHGAGKRLLRVRAVLRPSRLARGLVGGAAAAAVLAAIIGLPAIAVALAVVAAVSAVAVGWQAVVFAGRLHQIIEAAAHETGLVPVDPVARPLPVGAPRTA
jgi:hypothetical protein